MRRDPPGSKEHAAVGHWPLQISVLPGYSAPLSCGCVVDARDRKVWRVVDVAHHHLFGHRGGDYY